MHDVEKRRAKGLTTITKRETKKDRKSKYEKNRKAKLCPFCQTPKERLDKHLQRQRSECGKKVKDRKERLELVKNARVVLGLRGDRELIVLDVEEKDNEKEDGNGCVGCEEITKEVAEDVEGGSDISGDELMRQFLFVRSKR